MIKKVMFARKGLSQLTEQGDYPKPLRSHVYFLCADFGKEAHILYQT